MSQEKKISVKKTVYKKNDELAEKIRLKMRDKGKLFFNIMGSIGAGKTLLLENLAVKLSSKYRVSNAKNKKATHPNGPGGQ